MTSDLDQKISIITKHPILFLIGIGIVGFLIRMYYFPSEIPIIHDSIDYFSYAVVTSQEGHFPVGWDLSNNGWPAFLSIFFTISSDGGLWEFMNIQRVSTVVISVLTIIPIYLLCSRFVPKKFALIGAALFIFDPRIISHSLLGITETSYVLLGSLALYLFLSKDIRVVSASFGVLALFTLIRYEGIVLLIPFLAFFIIRFRSKQRVLLKLLGVIVIFLLILFPIVYLRIQATGNDGIISGALGGAEFMSKHIVQGIPDEDDAIYDSNFEENRVSQFITLGFTNLLKYIGWTMIPIFIFFVPVGFFIFLRSHNDKIKIIIFCMIFLLIPAFYAYGRGIEETRYLYVLFPIFCVFSSFTLMKLYDMVPRKWLGTLLICGILIGSVMFLDYQKVDYEHERESYLIAKEITKIASGINHYNPESKYIHIAEIEQNWPIIPLPKETPYDQTYEIKKISPSEFSTLVEYIQSSEDKGLTHIVSDGKQDAKMAIFLNDVFYYEKKFPYLIKEYDSHEQGFQYHVKVYKINFEKFAELYPKN